MNNVKKSYFLLLFAFSFLACDGNEKSTDRNSKSTEKQALNAQKKSSSLENTLLTEENAQELLTAYGQANPETFVLLHTRLGQMKIRLYEETPLHRANFIMLCKRGYYDSTLFYRVIKKFMIQGGTSDDPKLKKKQRKIGNYLIASEINPNKFFHKRGAIAAARKYEDNPKKLSSCFDFYIIQGEKQTLSALDATAKEYKLRLTEEQKRIYTTIGGAAHLDGEHTVFGEVVEGLEVLDKIAAEPVGEGDWPIKNIFISCQVLGAGS